MAQRLSIVVPAYNEERTVGEIMERLFAACPFAELIFVDDGSRDATLSILRSKARPGDIVLTKTNGGKGSAVRMGYEHATGTYTIVQDADLEYRPEEIVTLLTLAESTQCGAVFGSRRIRDQKQYAHVLYYIGGIALTMLFNVLYGTRLTDQPNCYKLVRTDILKQLRLTQNGFGFDAELTCLLARAHVRILEAPTSYHPRSVSEGKKIRWTDWIEALWIFLRLRFHRPDSSSIPRPLPPGEEGEKHVPLLPRRRG